MIALNFKSIYVGCCWQMCCIAVHSQQWREQCAQSAQSCLTTYVKCQLCDVVICFMPIVSSLGSVKAWHALSVDRRSPEQILSTNSFFRGPMQMTLSLVSQMQQWNCHVFRQSLRRHRINSVFVIVKCQNCWPKNLLLMIKPVNLLKVTGYLFSLVLFFRWFL